MKTVRRKKTNNTHKFFLNLFVYLFVIVLVCELSKRAKTNARLCRIYERENESAQCVKQTKQRKMHHNKYGVDHWVNCQKKWHFHSHTTPSVSILSNLCELYDNDGPRPQTTRVTANTTWRIYYFPFWFLIFKQQQQKDNFSNSIQFDIGNVNWIVYVFVFSTLHCCVWLFLLLPLCVVFLIRSLCLSRAI